MLLLLVAEFSINYNKARSGTLANMITDNPRCTCITPVRSLKIRLLKKTSLWRKRSRCTVMPKESLWLSIAELELSALSHTYFSRRIGIIEEIDREMQALVKERNELSKSSGNSQSHKHERSKPPLGEGEV